MKTVIEHINEKHGGNQRRFAAYLSAKYGIKVWPQQITEWINKGFVVIDDELYSRRQGL